MKKLLLALFIALEGIAAVVAQGKLNVVNDSLHLLYFGTLLKARDAALAGQLLSSSPTPSDATFLVDLYGGADADSMTLQTTATMNATLPGIFGPMGFESPNLPGGVVATMQVKVRESSFATAEAAQNAGGYHGFSSIFTIIPGAAISRPSLVNHGGIGQSTWADGVADFGTSGFGAIIVEAIPEPNSLFLTGFSVLALLTARRRKPYNIAPGSQLTINSAFPLT
ncbi:MAG: PEP-CTERM sorting domain-containing protein [Verrucomicrobiota bacterium]